MHDSLIMDVGGPVAGGRLLFNDVDELKGAAEGGVRLWPLGTLKVTNF